MAWRVLVGVYVAAVVAALLIVNGDQSGAPAAAAVVAAGSIALGWGTASGWGAVVAWLLVPVALPFGETNQFTGGGGTDLVVLLAAVSAAMSTVLIFAAARARVLYDRLRPRRRASQPATNGALPSLDPTSAIDPGLRDAAPINAPTPAARQPTAAHRR